MDLARLHNTIETFTGINDITHTPSIVHGNTFTKAKSAFDVSAIEHAGNIYSTTLSGDIKTKYDTIQTDLSYNSQYINDVSNIGLPIDIITVLYTSGSGSSTFKKMTYTDGITVKDRSGNSYYISLKPEMVFARKYDYPLTSNSENIAEQFMNFSNQNTIEGLATASSRAAISAAKTTRSTAQAAINTANKQEESNQSASTSNSPSPHNYHITDNSKNPYIIITNHYNPKLSVMVPKAPPIPNGEVPPTIGRQFQVKTLMPPTQDAVNTYFKTPQSATVCRNRNFKSYAKSEDLSYCEIHAAQTLLDNYVNNSSPSQNIYYYNDSNNCYTCIDSSKNRCLGTDFTSSGILSGIYQISKTYKEFYSHTYKHYSDISNALNNIENNGIVLEDATSTPKTYYAIEISDVSGYIHTVKNISSNQKPLSKLTVDDVKNMGAQVATHFTGLLKTYADTPSTPSTPSVSDISADDASTATFKFKYVKSSNTLASYLNTTSPNLTSVSFTRIAAVRQNGETYYVDGADSSSNINGCPTQPIQAKQLSFRPNLLTSNIRTKLRDYSGNTYKIGYNPNDLTQAHAYYETTPNSSAALSTSALQMLSSYGEQELHTPSNTLYGPSSIQESFDNNTTARTARQNLMQTQLKTHNFGSKPSDVNSKTLININTQGYGEIPAHLGTYSTTLRHQAGNLTNSTNTNIKESSNILNEISTRQKNITTARAQHEDAYLNRISNNYHSIAWTIGAVALIGATIKLSK